MDGNRKHESYIPADDVSMELRRLWRSALDQCTVVSNDDNADLTWGRTAVQHTKQIGLHVTLATYSP